MFNKLAVYAGTFDPLTSGHQWMIEKGSQIFSRLQVAIGENPDKRCMFSLEERLETLTEAVGGFPNVKVSHFTNQYLVRYAQSIGAEFIIRGIRNEADYEYERTLRHLNSDLDSSITTIFLMPPREIAEVSSSVVKSLVGPEGWETIVKRFVSERVFKKLQEVHSARSK